MNFNGLMAAGRVLGTSRQMLQLRSTLSSIEESEALVQPPPPQVFISFRGEDSRNGFVSHLYSALKDKGIRTYYDEDNLQEGQPIEPKLMKAIEESSIDIVVLTRNYGSSSWCMTELVKILECQKTHKLVVFPIFYNVEPSDVRKYKVNRKDDVQMVEIWKQALTEVAGIKGKDILGKSLNLDIRRLRGYFLYGST